MRRDGFTLLEMLLAMAIFMILVLICAQLFQQARMAWSTGQDKVDKNMVGRSVLDCITRDLSQAIVDSNVTITATSIKFRKLSATAAAGDLVEYNFDGSMLQRNGAPICPGLAVAAPTPGIKSINFSPEAQGDEFPPSVDISVEVAVLGESDEKKATFQTRVWFTNKHRFSE